LAAQYFAEWHPLDANADVWTVPLSQDPAALVRSSELLSNEERARADSFRFQADRTRYVVAHAALRVLLAGALGRTPRELRFERTSRGKPYLADAGIHFNLAHSTMYALVGVSRDSEIGVDTESIRATVEYQALAERYFAPEEVAWLDAAPIDQRRSRFFRMWTVKEAFLKATGEGLGRPLADAVVTFAPDGGATLSDSGWTAEESAIVPGHAAAAVVRDGITIRWHEPAGQDLFSPFPNPTIGAS
jgi:4'-phosphopantetheinyl transferase